MHEVTRMPSGLRVVSRHMPDTASVTVSFFVGSGARYEDMDIEYGAAHFIEHLLFKGSQKRPTPKQIVELIDGVGGYMNAYTSEDHTCFYIKLPSKHFNLAMDILADTLTQPLFDAHELERERGVITEEMRVYEDDPARFVFDMVGPLLWPRDTLRSNIIGTEQTIAQMKRDTIMDYFDSLYSINNMVVAVAGNVKHSQVLDQINRYMQVEPRPLKRHYAPSRSDLATKKVDILRRQTSQAHLVIAGRGPALDDSDEMALRLLCTILGDGMSSRLFMNVRERLGLAYWVFMHSTQFVDTGKFEIYAGVTHDKATEALRAITSELNIIRDHLVEEKELHKAREQLRGRLIMGLESNSAVADRLGTQMILQDKIITLAEVIDQIDAVSNEDILLVARKYLQPELLRLAVIGDFDSTKSEEFAKIISAKE